MGMHLEIGLRMPKMILIGIFLKIKTNDLNVII